MGRWAGLCGVEGGWRGCRAPAGGTWRGGSGGRGAVGQRWGPCPYPFQHLIQVVAELHEQVDLPAGVAVHRVDLGKGGDIDGRQTPASGERASIEGREREGRASPARAPSPAALGLPAWAVDNGGHAGRQAGRGHLSPSGQPPTPLTSLQPALSLSS